MSLCSGKQGSGEMVGALLLAGILHSDPQCTGKLLLYCKEGKAESSVEAGINLTPGCSPKVQASKVRLDRSQKVKASLQR